MKKINTFVLASFFMILYPIAIVIRNTIFNVPHLLSPFHFTFILKLITIILIGGFLLKRKINLIISILLSFWVFIDAYYLTSLTDEFIGYPSNLFSLVTSISLLLLSVFSYLGNSKKIFKFWFLPVFFSLLNVHMTFVTFHNQCWLPTGNNYKVFLVFSEFVLTLGSLFLALSFKEFSKISLENRKKNMKKEYKKEYKENFILANNGYCDMLKHVLLLIFTGFIWGFLWVYAITDFLNTTQNTEKRNPTKELLLYIFLPFYHIYWTYKSSKQIELLAHKKSIASDIVTLSTLFSFLLWIIPPIIMQNKLNQICILIDKQTASTAKMKTMISNIQNNGDKTKEIRNYKELLNEGIITEEEFETKKKQLLGL